MLVVGLDVGTQGARAILGDVEGRVVAQANEALPAGATPTSLPPGWSEQVPAAWWAASCACLRRVMDQRRGEAVAALAVTSTSGTICPVDGRGVPLAPALMYNDARAVAEAEEVQRVGAEVATKLGYRYNASFALAKILWLNRHQPQLFSRAHLFVHPTDYLVGLLTGEMGVSDFSSALKTGYDLIEGCWPGFLEDALDIPLHKLPRVVTPGTAIGQVRAEAAGETGLPTGTPVVAGMTDGCASQVAAGAVEPGEWNSTLGTTLVIKGVTEELLRDPAGRIYSHRHPDGYWLPGGASNTGGEALAVRFSGADLAALDEKALAVAPTGVVIYPLVRRGERFPFVYPDAEGFTLGEVADEVTLYAAHLEGVGYVERLAYEVLRDLGGEIGERIYVAGAAARSVAWLQLRADILNRALVQPDNPSAAMGAAILAASRTIYEGVIPAARAMVRIARTVEPRTQAVVHYEDGFQRFRQECVRRGYIA
jgi:sugar (pentulose or hexulose) kinase